MSETHAQEPRIRAPMSAEQRTRLSAAQLAYIANDPRWAAHRQRLADAQIARRMPLFPNEIEVVVTMRKKAGRFLTSPRKSGSIAACCGGSCRPMAFPPHR